MIAIPTKNVLLSCFFLALPSFSAKGEGLQKMRMEVGAVRKITCVDCHTLQMSRKGVVQVIATDKDRFHVVALRKGVVVLTFSDQSKHFAIEVLSPEIKKKSNEVGKKVLDRRQYWLDVHAVSIEEKESFEKSSIEHLDYSELSSREIVLNRKQQSYYAQSVARPHLRIEAERSYTVKSGGEFAESYVDQDFVRQRWKYFGFSMDIEIAGIEHCRLAINYDISLSHPQKSGGRQSLSQNKISGHSTVSCGHESLLAVIDLTRNQKVIKENPLLAGVPIVGPLFQGEDDKSGHLKMALFINLRKVN